MKKLKNIWYNCHNINSKEYFTVECPVFTYKTGSIYKLGSKDYLYAENDRVFGELAGLNKDHLKSVIDRTGSDNWLYDRAIENLNK